MPPKKRLTRFMVTPNAVLAPGWYIYACMYVCLTVTIVLSPVIFSEAEGGQIHLNVVTVL